jgi:hypothetical protein
VTQFRGDDGLTGSAQRRKGSHADGLSPESRVLHEPIEVVARSSVGVGRANACTTFRARHPAGATGNQRVTAGHQPDRVDDVGRQRVRQQASPAEPAEPSGAVRSAAGRKKPARVASTAQPTSGAVRAGRPRAAATPADHPGALPPRGGRISATPSPLAARAQEITEFEFHISPAPTSSRPQTWAGTEGVTASSCLQRAPSRLSRVRAIDRLRGVGDRPTGPAVDLIPEKSRVTSPPGASSTLSADWPHSRCRRSPGVWAVPLAAALLSRRGERRTPITGPSS